MKGISAVIDTLAFIIGWKDKVDAMNLPLHQPAHVTTSN